MEDQVLDANMNDRVARSNDICNNTSGIPLNLDNGISAKPSVQVCRDVVATNGCLITLNFSDSRRSDICLDISKMLIEAFVDRRSNCNE